MSQHGQEAVYEMLWDCKFCGQKKLLGVTHRFCANCGGPQDPAARYFPADHEKVPVQSHPYVGADVHCPACHQPMSRAVKCCTNCGSPLDQGREVALRADQYVPPPGMHAPPPYPPPPRPGFAAVPQPGQRPMPAKSSNVALILLAVFGGIFVLIVGLFAVAALWKKDGVFAVTGHTWERTIAVERYDAFRRSVWCDDVPASARILSRRREQRGTERKADGETCGTRKKDLGNGSYKEVKECTPKYKEVPSYADKCDIEVTEWQKNRVATAKGTSIADAPRWPETNARGGICLGCEREGSRTERYVVLFTDTKSNEKADCALPQNRWSAFPLGSKWKGKVGVMTGSVDCDDLQKP